MQNLLQQIKLHDQIYVNKFAVVTRTYKCFTMSVAGFDVGNSASCVALARKRGVDVIMNAESKRETPSIVSYGDKMRFVGVQGAARLTMNVKNTVVQVKRLIGRKFSDPVVQEDIKDFMFKVVEGPDGGCLIKAMYLNEPREFTPEQVMTSLLKDLKAIAEADQGGAITDCVVAVPAYFSEAERLSMLNAASIAGLKCLRLMNEPTAIALNWGIFKTDLPEDKPLNVVFVDVGHASLQVRLCCKFCVAGVGVIDNSAVLTRMQRFLRTGLSTGPWESSSPVIHHAFSVNGVCLQPSVI